LLAASASIATGSHAAKGDDANGSTSSMFGWRNVRLMLRLPGEPGPYGLRGVTGERGEMALCGELVSDASLGW
jgi:hypothetical protein